MFSNPELNNIYNSLQNNTENLCVICMEKLSVGITNLKCNHFFHTECLKNSFKKYEVKKCPYCRKYINWNTYKNKCSVIKRNKEICNKISYSSDNICSYHTKLKLRKINKLDNSEIKDKKLKIKNLKSEKNKISKNITTIKNKINNLISQFVKLQDKKKKLINNIGILENNISNII